jgi:hypothetical protein
MFENMRGEKYGEALEPIPFSNSAVMRHVASLSDDIKKQRMTRRKCGPEFAFQIDESTDVAHLPQLCLSDTVSKKTSRKSSRSVCRFQTDVQAVSDCFTADDVS